MRARGSVGYCGALNFMKIKQKLILAFVANTLLVSVLLSVFSITQSREAAERRFAELSV